ncbi:MAG TPA: TonB-dependent receptor [Terriglobales bacterium]|nr:TonB-dependent receptor [Terriglobales bacterium]
MSHRFRLSRIFAVVLAILLAAGALPAQTSRGTVSGIVTDQTGAVVANAKVVLTQVETNAVRDTVTNGAGLYRFDAVNLGTYVVKVTAPGFANAETHGLVVRANQTSSMDFQLQVGNTSETLEVAATASSVALQTDEQLRGRNIEPQALANLPITGQNSLNLMTLVPGIVPTNMSGGGSLDSGIGSVNGSRPRANNFMLDGVENNDISVAGPAITLTNNDALQEVSVQTSNFSAEFGRSGGAVINQITKSGTNNLHGTAAWVYRSQRLNASSFDQRYSYYQGGGKADGDPLKPSFLEHIPAFTVGGPVYIPGVYNGKDKTFFFVAGQWDRLNNGAYQRIVTAPTANGVATLQALAATCPNARLYLNLMGGQVATIADGATDISVPQAVYDKLVADGVTPTCTAGTANPTRAGMNFEYGSTTRAVPRLYAGNTIQARVDHILSEKHQLSFRFLQSPGSYKGIYALGVQPEFDAGYLSKSYTGAITDTYVISSHVTNELRLNYARVAVDWPLMAAPGSLGATHPTIAITGFTTMGTSASYPQGRTFNNYELQDTMTWIHGKHTFRFGLDVNKQIARQSAPVTTRGALTYADATSPLGTTFAFANFLDDFSGTGLNTVSRQFGTPVYHPTTTRQSYFIQDSWKATPQLTLNFGLRYDLFGQPANGNFPYPAVSMDPANFPNKAEIPVDKNNFGPNFGFSYNPQWGFFSDGKTVIRGGFQIGYDGWYNNLLSNMAAGAPNNPTNVAYNGVANSATPRGQVGIYNVRFPTLTAAAFNPLADSASQFTPNIRNPYTMRWSFGVQRETRWGMLVDLSYVGSVGRKLFISRELNPVMPRADGTAGTRMFPTMGSRTVRDSAANSNYNSLQLDVRSKAKETVLGGVTFTSSYTWSHNLDVQSETFATSGQQSAYASSRWLALQDLNIDYGNSDLDRRHRWVTSLIWDIRGPKHGFLGQAFGGWSITAAIPVMSGTPFSVSNNYDRDGDGSAVADRPNIGNTRMPIWTRALISTTAQNCASGLWNPDAKGCTTADQVYWVQAKGAPNEKTARRNNVFSEGAIYADVNVMKKFRVTEGFNLEARAEIFNIGNNMNFNYAPTGLNGYGLRITQPAGRFMPWQESDYYTSPGNRTMRLQLKAIF